MEWLNNHASNLNPYPLIHYIPDNAFLCRQFVSVLDKEPHFSFEPSEDILIHGYARPYTTHHQTSLLTP